MIAITNNSSEALHCIYNFLVEKSLYEPEIMICNSNSKEYSTTYVFARDIFAKIYTASNIPTFEEFEKVAKENNYMIAAIAGINKEDKEGVVLMLTGENNSLYIKGTDSNTPFETIQHIAKLIKKKK